MHQDIDKTSATSSSDSLSDETTHLERVFQKNNYNSNFIKLNTYRNTTKTNETTNNRPTRVTTTTIPYIKGTSETIVPRIFQPYDIRVAHEPITTLRHTEQRQGQRPTSRDRERCTESKTKAKQKQNKKPTNHCNFHVLTTNHITTKLTNPNHDQRHKYHHLATTLHSTLKMTRELKMTPLVGALTSLNNLLEERRYPCTVPKGDLSRGTLFFFWEWPRQSCPINTCKWQLHKLCGHTPQDDFVKQAQPKLPGRYTYGHTTDCFKALSVVLAGFASPCFIRQLSLFRAPIMLWFIDLTVATCHIHYTLLSLCQICFSWKQTEYENVRVIRKWPPAVTRRAKH